MATAAEDAAGAAGSATMAGDGPFTFDEILEAELGEVMASRAARRAADKAGPVATPDTDRAAGTGGNRSAGVARRRQRWANRHNLFGLALSGGGIRSATFNLGVLQTLARFDLLRRLDYLSTVSGGGYIGSWLSAWIARDGITTVTRELDHASRSGRGEAREIRHLRENSNYLTPRPGFFSADTWTAVAIYLRNVSLNLVMLALVLGAGLMVLGAIHQLRYWMSATVRPGAFPWYAVVLGLLWLVTSRVCLYATGNDPRGQSSRWVWGGIVVPLFLSALVLGAVLAGLPPGAAPSPWLVAGSMTVAGLLVFLVDARPLETVEWRDGEERPAPRLLVWLMSVAGGVLAAGGTLYAAQALLRDGAFVPDQGWRTWLGFLSPAQTQTLWNVPILLVAFAAGGTAYIGLMGQRLDTGRREWWGRLGGLLLVLIGAWAALFLVLFFGEAWSRQWDPSAAPPPQSLPALAAWLATTVWGLLTARSVTTNGNGGGAVKRAALMVAPYVFVVGLLLALSVVVGRLLLRFDTRLPDPGASRALWLAGTAAVLVLAAALLSRRVRINQFSMHNFYRNRLARCYQGARAGRTRHPFTGFSAHDHAARVSDLVSANVPRPFEGPYPIMCAALNMVRGDNLAWQRRMAASFMITPRYSGFDCDTDDLDPAGDPPPGDGVDTPWRRGLRPTDRFAGGLSLSDAMAVSGAAAAPNMGYHSSVPLAFLMTVFNVRLGLWLGNPKNGATWNAGSPAFALYYLFAELFAATTSTSPFVYLSDGGHFENLGIYELVRRRCRFIIACDAEADPDFTFDGLGNAIEKCRADLGTEIRIDVEAVRKARTPADGAQHCVAGTIDYGPDLEPGILVYVKASVTGDEPTDVQRYRSQHPAFPHQPTGDQLFDETQFESYRRLGEHAMWEVLFGVDAPDRVARMANEQLFGRLQRRWYPPSPYSDAAFSRHGEEFGRLMRELRQDSDLAFLATQLNPSWKFAAADPPAPVTAADMELPPDPDVRRKAYFLCREMIQLMENVYLDLHLETEQDHPDNQGWMNLFRNWSWASMFRVTWATTASTYGARFRDFARRYLHLEPGNVVIGDPTIPPTLPSCLNVVEAEFAREACEQATARGLDGLVVQPIIVSVEVPLLEGAVVELPVGFLVRRETTLVYLRIQDHLWTMGLGEKAVETLIAAQQITSWYAWFDESHRADVTFAKDGQRVLVSRAAGRRFARLYRRGREARRAG